MILNAPYESESDNLNDNCNCSEDECVRTNYQYANVSVPIQLRPSATTGNIVVECCEEPVVECRGDERRNSCEITITQKVCIKIPISYQIDACAGESVIECDCGNCQ